MVRKNIRTENLGRKSYVLSTRTMISLLQEGQQDEPPDRCHTEIQTKLKEGAKAEIVCVGDCSGDDKCHKVSVPLGKSRKMISCVCKDDDFAEKCNLIVIVKGDEIETSFCAGDCAKGKKCERGFKVEKDKVRFFCVCK